MRGRADTDVRSLRRENTGGVHEVVGGKSDLSPGNGNWAREGAALIKGKARSMVRRGGGAK